MISSATRRAAVIAALITTAVLLTMSAAVSATGASQPRRQLAVTTLSNFKVVITATRGPGHPPMATVTAAGYRRSGTHWKLIATKRIGTANQWFWFSVDTCSLTTTQLQGVTPTTRVASIKISLLITPAIGCSRTFSKHWQP
jgi:ABC-type amino acid transport substrate-binding protein